MFCRRKRPPVISDSSDDDRQRPKKQLKLQNAGNPSFSGTRKRRLNENINSRNNFTHNLQQERLVSYGEASSSSDIEEIFSPVKRGSLRALSDYETGDSTDKASRASSSTGTPLGPCLFLSTSSEAGEVLHSSSDNDVIQPTKRRKIQSSFFSSSDSSDSGVPIGFRRPTKQLKLPSSSEESGSDYSFDSEPITESARRNSSASQRNRSNRITLGPVRRESSRLLLGRSSPNRINIGQSRQQTRRSLRIRNNNRDTSIQVRLNVFRLSTGSSSDESDTNFSRDNFAQIREAARTSRRRITMNRRSTNTNRHVHARQQDRTQLRPTINSENNRNNIQRQSRVVSATQSQDEYSSDSVIHVSLRHRRVPLIPSEDSSSSSDRRVLLRHESGSQGGRLNGQSQSIRRIAVVSETEGDSSSESDIHLTFRHRRVPMIVSEDNTSDVGSSDSAESELIQNQIRRGALLTIHESEEEDGTRPSYTAIDGNNHPKVNSMNQKTSTALKTTQENSSDSDGESEKCPICLIRFHLQEVGTPSSCSHNFCSVCIQEWAKNKNTCPVDRQPFNSIIVRAHIQGKVILEVPIETPPPERNIVQSFLELWGNVNANLITINERSSSSEYEDGPEETCCVCRQSHDSGNMIFCDFCSNVYHLNCVNPPLQYVPAEDWYCPDCAHLGKAWKEVCRVVVGPDKWNSLPLQIQNVIGKEVQKRWKNMRDAYIRSIRDVQQNNKSGSATSKKKPYIFHKPMSFLQHAMELRVTSGNMNDISVVEGDDDLDNPSDGTPTLPSNAVKPSTPMRKKRKLQDPFERDLITVLNRNVPTCSVSVPQKDADEMFLTSLLPYMKQMPTEDKLDFQIKTLQLIQSYRPGRRATVIDDNASSA